MPSTRFFVARTRLSRIRRFASVVRRWLISSPIRFTTASTSANASAGGRSVAGSQACQVTVRLVSRARSGFRLRPTTSFPRASRASATAEPIIPLAPVMRTLMSL